MQKNLGLGQPFFNLKFWAGIFMALDIFNQNLFSKSVLGSGSPMCNFNWLGHPMSIYLPCGAEHVICDKVLKISNSRKIYFSCTIPIFKYIFNDSKVYYMI